ncbi:MAG: DUF5060 domain-containing protein, partial [Flavisolibacter sp.]|nr:DUF5060 domain-containing protein [Flavisolibacter sp.]
MKKYCLSFLLFFHCLSVLAVSDTVECWGRFETSFKGPQSGNPFTDVWLTADFFKGNQHNKVNGFYDGEGIFKIRFMP